MNMEEPRIGVFICDCGVNISAKVDVPDVVEFAERLPNVVVARENKYMCSEPGQKMIQDAVREYGLTRVVVASSSITAIPKVRVSW